MFRSHVCVMWTRNVYLEFGVVITLFYLKKIHMAKWQIFFLAFYPTLCSFRIPQRGFRVKKQQQQKEQKEKVNYYWVCIIQGNIISNKLKACGKKWNSAKSQHSKQFYPLNIRHWGKLETVKKSFSTLSEDDEVCRALVCSACFMSGQDILHFNWCFCSSPD